jgi:hypothetical protein
MAANLATPREIKGLRDAVQSADSDRLQGQNTAFKVGLCGHL